MQIIAEIVYLIKVILFSPKVDGFLNSQLLCCTAGWISHIYHHKM